MDSTIGDSYSNSMCITKRMGIFKKQSCIIWKEK